MTAADTPEGWRNLHVPETTLSEQLRRDFGVTVAWVGVGLLGVLLVAVWRVISCYVDNDRSTVGWSSPNDTILRWLVICVIATAIGMVYLGIRQSKVKADPGADVERRWTDVLVAAGVVKSPDGLRVRYWRGGLNVNEVLVKLPDGSDPSRLDKAARALAHSWGVPGVKVWRVAGGWQLVELVSVLPPPEPEPVTVEVQTPYLPKAKSWKAYFEALPIGWVTTHTGSQYKLPYGGVQPDAPQLPREFGLRLLGTHLAIAGETGAGKSSWEQSIISALAPAVAHGAAKLVGIDPKGVELAMSRGIFAHYASEPDSIADLLELMVEKMSQRKKEMAGKSRLIRPSADMPLYVIMIDELFAVGKGELDKKRKERITGAMNLLLTQGRALGFSLVGCIQDPTKENFSNRDLFNTRVAMKLTAGMTDVVLGPKCREEGATAHLLTEAHAGSGYLRDGDGWALVRAYWKDDAQIVSECGRFTDGRYFGNWQDGDIARVPIDEAHHPDAVMSQRGWFPPNARGWAS
ncbi:FtsK/SpoIIIE domain-containing protein [Pseudonocardia sp. RS010]|uniref:FtsK/SpoIIIE domain-containing protein n=1 Tax=Pseudonocardia sp. RS010 TaxID=3385979 RepID=UPI00399FBD00